MRNSLIKSVTLFTLLLIVGVGNVWGDNWYEHNNSSNIYFNDYTTNWVSDPSTNGICFLIGRDYKYNNNPTADVGSQAYRMSHIANTKLWHCSVPSWGTGDAAMYQYVAFRYAAGTTGWNDWGSMKVTDRAKYGSNTKYSMTRNDNITGRNQYYSPSSSSENTGYNDINNGLRKYTAYLRVKYDENRTGTYGSVISGSTTWPHGVTFDFTGTYMPNASTSAQSKISSLTSNGWDSDSNKGYENIPVTGEVHFELKGIDTGFELAGWEYAEDASAPAYTTNPNDVTFQVLGNTSYVAFIRRKQYTVTLNDNGGSGGSGSATPIYDKTDNLTSSVTVPTKSGYDFQGYYTNNDGTGKMLINSSGAWQKNVTDYTGESSSNPKWIYDGDVTLYAKWTQSVALNPENGNSNSSVTMTYNSSSHDAIANPEKTGYTFAGWYTAAEGNSLVIATNGTLQNSTSYTDASGKWTNSGSAPTLHAHWTSKTYDVRFENLDADAGHKGSQDTIVTFNDTINMRGPIEKPSKNLYTFDGYWISTDKGKTVANLTHQLIDANGNWIKDVSPYTGNYNNTYATWILAADTVLYAKWTETLHTITIQSGGNGTVSPASVNVGGVTSSGAITATPNTGYHFRDWTLPAGGIVTTHEGTSSTDATIHIKATGSGTITANFDPNTYVVRLEDKGADVGHTGTPNVSVTYNATTGLTSAIECPQKNHYTFGGYYISNDRGATLTNTQLIDENGNWNTSVSGYIDENKKWICAGDTTLYAKWTETTYAVNIVVSPSEAGSVKVNGSTVSQVTAGFATHSPQLTADSVNALWTFKEWQATSDAHLQTGSYSIYRPTMEITAEAANQTVTAVFQHRYNLLGSQYAINTEKQNQELGGMPGWTYGSGADFTVNSYPGDGDNVTVELVCTRNLVAGTYIFEIHDRATGKSLGRKKGSSIYILGEGESVELRDGDDQNQSIFFYPQAAGEYTFKITLMRKSGVNYYPTVTILRPQQVHLGWKYENIGGSLSDGNTGGTAEIKKKSDNSDVPNGTWLTYGTVVTYNANPVKGYKVDWYANNDYSTSYITSSYSFDHDGTSTGNGYVKFTELATKVSLENDGHGHIEIDGVTRTDTTCGVTTTRSLTAVPNTGYSFSNWSKPSGDDIDFNTSINPTTLKANGNGLQEGQRVRANFTAKTYTVTLDNDHGNAENNGSATATYASSTLTDKTDATFSGWSLLGYWNNTAVQVINSDGTLIAGVSGYTDGSSNWIYDGNVSLYAHWSRSVTLDREGGSTGAESMTVTYKGTTLGSYSAPTRTGYTFAGYWTGDNGTGTLVINTGGTLEANVSGYTDASNQWIKQDATTLYAKWTANSYTVTLHNDHDGAASDDGAATVTYNATSLTVSNHASFEGWNLLGYWNSSAVQVANADGSLIAGVTNFTDASAHWTKTDNADLWAHWSRTITLDKNGGKTDGSVTVTYKGTATTPTAPVYSGYTLEGYYAEPGCSTKVMNPNGTLVANVSGYTDGSNQWIHKTAATLYAKWTSPNFVIYRSGDKASDPHALSDAVETYAGGTLDKPIEFRMKVRTLDQWYSLCLPFEVNAVKVWDEEDKEYYDIQPYYRTDGTYYLGHYIIRTPKQTSNFSIAEFDDWRDPTTYTEKPTKNTPYIIQWHMDYFSGRYISFFGATGQTIPTDFSAGSAPASENVVNVCTNNTMHSGSVAGAYMLEGDYGSDGAWLRLADASASRIVQPFECYILAASATTAKYRIIRRGMTLDETTTGWDDVVNSEQQTTITVYTLTGMQVTQYTDCSISEAAQRLSAELYEGLFILRSENESVKLMLGGK